MTRDEILAELDAAQEEYLAAPKRRRAAVERALNADLGFTPYQIAKRWGVRIGTVLAIVRTIEKSHTQRDATSSPSRG